MGSSRIATRYITTFFQDVKPPPQVEVGKVTKLSVINADSDVIITDSVPVSGHEIDIAFSTSISFKAEVSSNVGSILWEVDGVEINRSNLTNHKILPDRVFSTPGYTIERRTRPFRLGIGIKTISLTPYSQLDLQGVKGQTQTFEVEFNTGTSLNLSPVGRFAANKQQLEAAINASNDDDRIYVTGNFSVLGYSPTLTKRIKFIGTGTSSTSISNMIAWTVTKGIVFSGIKVESYPNATLINNGSQFVYDGFSSTPVFNVANGAEGILIGNCEFSRCNKVVDTSGGDTIKGLVMTNCSGAYFAGNRAAVADIKSRVSNVMIRNNRFNTLIASIAACFGFKLGSDPDQEINRDICFFNNYIDTIDTNENGQKEVHGVQAFGHHVYIVGNTVKNSINRHDLPDREAYYGKCDYSYVAHNWAHNGGNKGQEGAFDFKGGENYGNLFEYNLVTNGLNPELPFMTMATGQAFTVHGECIFRENKAVLEFASSETSLFLHVIWNDSVSWFHDNEFIAAEAKFSRHTLGNGAPGGTSSTDHVYENYARIGALDEAGVWYKNNQPGNITIAQDGGDDFLEGGVPGGTDWYLAHVPDHGGNGWYPDADFALGVYEEMTSSILI